jgi:hypothetical protein
VVSIILPIRMLMKENLVHEIACSDIRVVVFRRLMKIVR